MVQSPRSLFSLFWKQSACQEMSTTDSKGNGLDILPTIIHPAHWARQCKNTPNSPDSWSIGRFRTKNCCMICTPRGLSSLRHCFQLSLNRFLNGFTRKCSWAAFTLFDTHQDVSFFHAWHFLIGNTLSTARWHRSVFNTGQFNHKRWAPISAQWPLIFRG